MGKRCLPEENDQWEGVANEGAIAWFRPRIGGGRPPVMFFVFKSFRTMRGHALFSIKRYARRLAVNYETREHRPECFR